jgi:integrase
MSVYKRSGKYYIDVKNPQGTRCRIAAFTSKRASEEFESKLLELSDITAINERPGKALVKWLETIPQAIKEKLANYGFITNERINASKTLFKLTENYKAYLKNNGRTKAHYNQTYNQCYRIIKDNSFRVCSDITADKLDRWLSCQRNEGMSLRTNNSYLVAFKSFCNWLVNTGKVSENPVRRLKKRNEKEDRRLVRRTLSDVEFSAFLKVARDGEAFKGISGYEWYLVFLTASQTGFRWSELKSLTRSSIDFDNMTITLQAKNTKNRKDFTMPLREELAELLLEHCRNKLPQAKLFKLPYRNCGGQAVKKYLSETGNPEKELTRYLMKMRADGYLIFTA